LIDALHDKEKVVRLLPFVDLLDASLIIFLCGLRAGGIEVMSEANLAPWVAEAITAGTIVATSPFPPDVFESMGLNEFGTRNIARFSAIGDYLMFER